MILTGETISAHEAERAGIVAKLFPAEQLLDGVIDYGESIREFTR